MDSFDICLLIDDQSHGVSVALLHVYPKQKNEERTMHAVQRFDLFTQFRMHSDALRKYLKEEIAWTRCPQCIRWNVLVHRQSSQRCWPIDPKSNADAQRDDDRCAMGSDRNESKRNCNINVCNATFELRDKNSKSEEETRKKTKTKSLFMQDTSILILADGCECECWAPPKIAARPKWLLSFDVVRIRVCVCVERWLAETTSQ